MSEIDAAVRADGRPDPTPLHLAPPQPALAPGAQFVCDPLTGGSIRLPTTGRPKTKPHELETAERLMRAGHSISFLHATGVGRHPTS